MAVQSTLRKPDRFSRLFDTCYTQLLASIRRWQHGSPLSKRTIRLIAAIALVLTILSSSYGGFRWRRRKRKEQEEGHKLVKRNSSRKLKDGSRVIYVPYKNGQTRKVEIHPTKATTFDAHKRLFLNPPSQTGISQGVPPANIKPGLNLAFLHQYVSLMSIIMPRWRGKEAVLLAMLSSCLVARTWLSVVVAKLEGRINGDLVGGSGRPFLKSLSYFLAIGVVGAGVNHYIKYLQAKVSIAFRTRLTRYIHDLYLNPSLAFYKLHNLDGGVAHADQFITHDVTLFCDSAASLFSSIGKPLVDLFVLNFQLYHSLGRFGVAALLVNYCFTATLLQKMAPPFGRMKANEGYKEGQFRALHARLIANAEEVAFYAGGPTEKVQLDRGFKDLRNWMQRIYFIKVGYNMLEDFVLKYCWSASGYLITSIPVFLPMIAQLTQEAGDWQQGKESTGAKPLEQARTSNQSSIRMQQFVTNKNIMLNLGDAGSRLMYSLKDLSELAGYTSRTFSLISALHRVNANAYCKTRTGYSELYSLADIDGTLARSFDGVRLENVPVVAPSLYPNGGEELIDNLSFQVRPGEHLLITGPNGAGKSAVSRIVAGLWPTFRGITSRPRNTGQDGIMFLPQRPYLTVGTLRDQVTYPHSEMDMQDSGRRESELQAILEQSKLGYLTEREGGWDTRKTWKDVLSGGEKQRMGIARLLYHEPRYAFVDEGTSAVSSDVEGLLYETCKGAGISKSVPAYMAYPRANL